MENTPPSERSRELMHALKQGGKLTTGDLWFLREELKNPGPHTDLYNAIRAIGWGASATPEHIEMVERYLHSPTDDYVISAAVQVLCDWWGLADRYLDTLLHYIHLEVWDGYSDAGNRSFWALGCYLHRTQRSDVYELLLRTVSDDLARLSDVRTDAPIHLNSHLWSAYLALCIGIKGDRSEFVRAEMLRLDEIAGASDLNAEILDEARKRAVAPT